MKIKVILSYEKRLSELSTCTIASFLSGWYSNKVPVSDKRCAFDICDISAFVDGFLFSALNIEAPIIIDKIVKSNTDNNFFIVLSIY